MILPENVSSRYKKYKMKILPSNNEILISKIFARSNFATFSLPLYLSEAFIQWDCTVSISSWHPQQTFPSRQSFHPPDTTVVVRDPTDNLSFHWKIIIMGCSATRDAATLHGTKYCFSLCLKLIWSCLSNPIALPRCPLPCQSIRSTRRSSFELAFASRARKGIDLHSIDFCWLLRYTNSKRLTEGVKICRGW